jgi:hypothetical protein
MKCSSWHFARLDFASRAQSSARQHDATGCFRMAPVLNPTFERRNLDLLVGFITDIERLKLAT